jgi:hypothetical protein
LYVSKTAFVRWLSELRTVSELQRGGPHVGPDESRIDLRGL